MVHIIDLTPENGPYIQAAAALLYEVFAVSSPGSWPDRLSALAEVQEALLPGRVCRAAIDEDGSMLGWIGGIPQYDGRVWELHPLLVRADRQRMGIGRALALDFEQQVRARGGLTITLGADDEDGSTSLSGVDLYTPSVWEHVARIRSKGHPFLFYQKLGFAITGVVPDANGWGRPDILMSKRVSQA